MRETNEWRDDYIFFDAGQREAQWAHGHQGGAHDRHPGQESPLDPKLGSTVEPHPK